ncbi:MAG: hypothetical protein ACKVS5_02755 [Parvularculaceae bacterium]
MAAEFPIFLLPAFAAAVAAGAGLVRAAAVEPPAAYGVPAVQVEAATLAETAARVFSRADLDNDGAVSPEEYTTLSVVTAELARLNGFVAIEYQGGLRTAALPRAAAWTPAERARVQSAAARDYALIAGDDERLTLPEFVDAELEALAAADRDRNGVLTGTELSTFAAIQAKLSSRQS